MKKTQKIANNEDGRLDEWKQKTRGVVYGSTAASASSFALSFIPVIGWVMGPIIQSAPSRKNNEETSSRPTAFLTFKASRLPKHIN